MGNEIEEMKTDIVDEKMETLPSSNSTSTSPGRRSRSSKSTRSGSNSSGYGGEPSTNGSSSNSALDNKIRKIVKRKDNNKIKQTIVKSIVTEPLSEPKVEHKDNVVSEVQVIEKMIEENAPSPVLAPLACADTSMEVHMDDKKIIKNKDGFSCIISMHDGVVLFTSTSLQNVLGFPKDMWIGRPFISFLHPKDCNLFTTHILGFISPKIINGMIKKDDNQSNTLTTIYCRIRRYRGLKSGYSVKDQKMFYVPFLLKFSLKNICDDDRSTVYLVVQAHPCISVYKAPSEILSKATPFVIRHLADGKCEYLDPESVPYLGYLPQDIKDQCVLQLYHPDDLYYLAYVYQTIVKEGVAPRSQSFRMMAHNGDYVRLETEWSSFVNPWSSKLEFVIGKHYVVEGPANPDILRPVESDKVFPLFDEHKIKTQFLKQNLVKIMNEVLTKPAEVAKQRLSKRCQDLAVFVEKLMEDPLNNQHNDDYDDVNSLQDRDVAGATRRILPRRVNSESDTDTAGTQLSYGQLNRFDILERYFESYRPYFEESQKNPFDLEDTFSKSNMMSLTEQNVAVSGGSANGETSESGRNINEYSGGSEMPLRELLRSRLARLTKATLQRHNADMERSSMTNGHIGYNIPVQERTIPNQITFEDHSQYRAVKRSASHLQEQPSCSKQYKMATNAPKEFVEPQLSLQQDSVSSENNNAANNVLENEINKYCDDPNCRFLHCKNIMHDPKNYESLGIHYVEQEPYESSCHIYDIASQIRDIENKRLTREVVFKNIFKNANDIKMNDEVNQSIYFQQTDPNTGVTTLVRKIPQNNITQQASVLRNVRKENIYAIPSTSYGNARNSYKNTPQQSASQGSTRNISDITINGQTRQNRTTVIKKSSESQNTYMPRAGPSYLRDYSTSNSSSTDYSSSEDIICNDKYKRNIKQCLKRNSDPPWMENISLTSEMMYNYTVNTRQADVVLSHDRNQMSDVAQPPLVNEQLAQLYFDMKLVGLSDTLILEETEASENEELSLPA